MRATSGPGRLQADAWRAGLVALVLAASTTWAALLWWAPVSLAGVTARGSGGLVPLASYVAGRTVCHQRPERSFSVAGIRQPVCARCAGLYLGAPLGVACAIAVARRKDRRRSAQIPPRVARRVVAWAAAPMLATIAIEWSRAAQPGNGLRFVLAVPLGAAVGWLTAAATLRQIDEGLE